MSCRGALSVGWLRSGSGLAREGAVRALIAILIFTAGCTSAGRSLSVEVDPSVTPRSVATYTIELQEMPGFLVPYFREELVAALSAHGAKEVDDSGDVAFVLRFSQLPLGENVARPDAMGESTGSVATSRFLARVELFAQAPNGAPVRLGMLSRAHAVATGAYMHARARAGFVVVSTACSRLFSLKEAR